MERCTALTYSNNRGPMFGSNSYGLPRCEAGLFLSWYHLNKLTNNRFYAIILRLPLRFTRGFDPDALMDHVEKHSTRLQITAGATEYEERADALFVNPKPDDVLECDRPDGDKIRFNKTTDEYGVMAADQIIRTYYIPIPCHKLAPVNQKPGRCHHERTNLEYFRRNCRRQYA